MSWTVGKVKITKVTELEMTGGTRFFLPQATYDVVKQIPWLIPDFANEDGKMKMAVRSLIVETPTRRIVVDTCIGNDKQNRDVPHWNNLNTPYLDDMAKAGYPVDSIDTVFCTHLHIDHVGWNTRLVDGQWVPTFTNARYIFVEPEYEYWKTHAPTPAYAAVFDDSVKPIMEAGKAELVAPTAKLCDELTLIPTPGHTPGHASIHIQSAGEEGLLTGDALHHPVQMWHPDWSSTPDTDPAQSARSKRALFSRFADTDTLVIGGHFDAGYIKRDGDRFKYVKA